MSTDTFPLLISFLAIFSHFLSPVKRVNPLKKKKKEDLTKGCPNKRTKNKAFLAKGKGNW